MSTRVTVEQFTVTQITFTNKPSIGSHSGRLSDSGARQINDILALNMTSIRHVSNELSCLIIESFFDKVEQYIISIATGKGWH